MFPRALPGTHNYALEQNPTLLVAPRHFESALMIVERSDRAGPLVLVAIGQQRDCRGCLAPSGKHARDEPLVAIFIRGADGRRIDYKAERVLAILRRREIVIKVECQKLVSHAMYLLGFHQGILARRRFRHTGSGAPPITTFIYRDLMLLRLG